MSEDHTARLGSLVERLTVTGLILADLFHRLPLPVSVLSRPGGTLGALDADDLINAAEIIVDMPGVPEAVVEELHQAAWLWVCAAYLTDAFRTGRDDNPGLCAAFLQIHCGLALKTAKAAIDAMPAAGDRPPGEFR
ncbi:hypothetical protein GCM10009839_49890 [Catenulispora yoronensis]|uniref:Uncharacterized protein n=1 Tax=Catenulispora yoronensis TaxID=450799 RepID=A0ABP5GAF1_9ACTN